MKTSWPDLHLLHFLSSSMLPRCVHTKSGFPGEKDTRRSGVAVRESAGSHNTNSNKEHILVNG